MTDTATLRARLSEAETALHDLSLGKCVVSVGSGDDSITYQQTNIDKLRAYIRDLKSQLGEPTRRPTPKVYF